MFKDLEEAKASCALDGETRTIFDMPNVRTFWQVFEGQLLTSAGSRPSFNQLSPLQLAQLRELAATTTSSKGSSLHEFLFHSMYVFLEAVASGNMEKAHQTTAEMAATMLQFGQDK